ncbi:MAG: 30S ribosomal protein S4e [Desulfurococcales archaeon]|nr:30S ribosomal protein S4e [Desulfurococcales archaeon]
MARMGGKKHLKRLATPSFWPILRKERVWSVKPSAGPHPIDRAVPLLLVVREMLGIAETNREARKVISEGHIKVDGKVRKNYKYPVGFMDVIEIVDTEEHFRAVPVPVKVMGLVPIPKEEASLKICRIENKTTVKGGHIQLNLHDGRNVLIRVSDPKAPEEDIYRTMGSVEISLETGEILKYFPLKEGVPVIVIGGRNVGRVAKILAISEGMRHYRKLVTLEDFKGNKFYTTLDKIMVIGSEKPEITLPEGAV